MSESILPRNKNLSVGRGGDNSRRLAIQNGHFGLRRDAEDRGWWLKPDRLVKAGLKIPHGPVHDDHGGALVDPDHETEAVVEPNDIAGAQPEGMAERPPDDSKLGLVRVNEAPFGADSFMHGKLLLLRGRGQRISRCNGQRKSASILPQTKTHGWRRVENSMTGPRTQFGDIQFL